MLSLARVSDAISLAVLLLEAIAVKTFSSTAAATANVRHPPHNKSIATVSGEGNFCVFEVKGIQPLAFHA